MIRCFCCGQVRSFRSFLVLRSLQSHLGDLRFLGLVVKTRRHKERPPCARPKTQRHKDIKSGQRSPGDRTTGGVADGGRAAGLKTGHRVRVRVRGHRHKERPPCASAYRQPQKPQGSRVANARSLYFFFFSDGLVTRHFSLTGETKNRMMVQKSSFFAYPAISIK